VSQLISIIGLRRSGLHAVVNWLIGLHPGRVRFVNDPPLDRSPQPANFYGCFDYDVSGDRIQLRPNLHLLRIQANQLNWSIAVRLPWPLNGLVRRVMKKFWEPQIMRNSCVFPELDRTSHEPPDLHIILFENLSPREAAAKLPNWLAAYRTEAGLPAVECEDIIIVLRSPWNCLASTLKHHVMGALSGSRKRSFWETLTRAKQDPAPTSWRRRSPDSIGELWTEYAQEFTGESQHFQPSRWQVRTLTYDHWMESPALRGTLAGELGCAPNDLGLAQISTYGGGSSFVGINQPPEKPADLTKRWQSYRNHPLMHTLLGSPEVRDLASALKMKIPDTISQQPLS
jgi:hypothetical protein